MLGLIYTLNLQYSKELRYLELKTDSLQRSHLSKTNSLSEYIKLGDHFESGTVLNRTICSLLELCKSQLPEMDPPLPLFFLHSLCLLFFYFPLSHLSVLAFYSPLLSSGTAMGLCSSQLGLVAEVLIHIFKKYINSFTCRSCTVIIQYYI